MDTFFTTHGDRFVPTVFTRGPWHIDHQHGGPPTALMVREAARTVPGSTVARVTIELLKPITIEPLAVEIEPLEMGRKVQRLLVRLRIKDVVVARANVLLVRTSEQTVPAAPGPTVASPESVEPLTFSFFSWDEGYHRAIDVRVVEGAWGSTPITVWGRSKIGLVDGAPITPLENLFVLADAESGIGPPVDVFRFTFVNPDMNAHLARAPEGEWLGLQVRSWAGGAGAGIASSVLFDRRGLVGRASQSCVVEPRG